MHRYFIVIRVAVPDDFTYIICRNTVEKKEKNKIRYIRISVYNIVCEPYFGWHVTGVHKIPFGFPHM